MALLGNEIVVGVTLHGYGGEHVTGRCNTMQHSEHVGQPDGTPHDEALSAQRYR